MNKHQAQELIQKYTRGLCTPEEKAIVESGFLSDLKSNKVNVSAEEVELESHRMLKNINDHISAGETRGNKPYTLFSKTLAIAASILLVAGFGWLFYDNYRPDIKQDATYSNNIKPGGNKAYLTLSDGKRIILTDAANGEIARQSGIKVIKTADGQVIYEITEAQKLVKGAAIYNTIETPKGGQYQLKLPDGTKVWLNAASSLRFPTSFAALKERKVQLNGEAYFEVAKDKNKAFLVSTVNQVIEVLGTHFNVNSYSDNAGTKTTLLEGAVKITSDKNITKVLKPGQQAEVTDKIIVSDANTEEAVAWKNGYFMFMNEPIESIMKKISRWYDVEIIYQDKLQNKALWGTVSRYKDVSEVLKRLELTGVVHFKVDVKSNEERRIIVMK